MTELFMDAKSSATMLRENSAKYMLWSSRELLSNEDFILTIPLTWDVCHYQHSYQKPVSCECETPETPGVEMALIYAPSYTSVGHGRRHHHVQYALSVGEVETKISIMYCITPVNKKTVCHILLHQTSKTWALRRSQKSATVVTNAHVHRLSRFQGQGRRTVASRGKQAMPNRKVKHQSGGSCPLICILWK